MSPSLIVIDGPLKGKVYPLDNAALSAGRDETNHLVIKDASVSRCHCQLELKD